jgi:hypothetical protein
MLRAFDLYGSRNRDLPRIRDLVARVAGVVFAPHYSEYSGGYYLGTGTALERVRISLNEMEDEDGSFFGEPDYPQYLTVVHIQWSGADPVPFLDDLRRELEGTDDGLVFLQRRISAAPGRGGVDG